MSLPPSSEIRSSQRIVSLQKLYYRIEINSFSINASKRNAIDTIAPKVCFKHIRGHTVLRKCEQWRVLLNSSIRQNPECSGKCVRDMKRGVTRKWIGAVRDSLVLCSFRSVTNGAARS